MGKKKHRSRSFTSQIPQKVEKGTIDYCANVVIMSSLTTTDQAIDKAPGKDFMDKIKKMINDEILKINSKLRMVTDIKVRFPTKEDEEFVTKCMIRQAQKEELEMEANHDYIGELVMERVKKTVLFRYPEIKESWRTQRDIWDNWKEFIVVFLDDLEDGEPGELQENDTLGTYDIPEEPDIRKRLLRDFPDDAEKLGFKKMTETKNLPAVIK